MNDQPPAGEKNPKYSLSRVKNAYFSTDYLIFVLIPVVLPPSWLPTHPKKFSRPSAGQIPYSRFFPNSGSLFPFFSRPTPPPPSYRESILGNFLKYPKIPQKIFAAFGRIISLFPFVYHFNHYSRVISTRKANFFVPAGG